MRVGIDCLYLDHKYVGGANTFVHGILHGLLENISQPDQIVIFCPEKEVDKFSYYRDKGVTIVGLNTNEKLRKILRIFPFLLRSPKFWRASHTFYAKYLTKIIDTINLKCDIFYCPNTTVNVYSLNVPIALSMHDIQHVHYPEYFSARERIGRLLNYEASGIAAKYMQASSMFMKKDFLNHFSTLKADNIRIISEGVDLKVFSSPSANSFHRKTEEIEPYFFFPAQIWHHKNHLTVLQAIKILNDRGRKCKLIMTGAKLSGWPKVSEFLNLHKQLSIEYKGVVSISELLELYQLSLAVISPAIYESSSLPVLEAIAQHSLIVASKTEPNLELGEIFHISFFDTFDAENLADVLEKQLDLEKTAKEKIISNNSQKLELFSWNCVGKQYLEWFEEILDLQ